MKNIQNAQRTLCERHMDVKYVLWSCYGRISDAISRSSRDMVVDQNGNDAKRTLQRRPKVATRTW